MSVVFLMFGLLIAAALVKHGTTKLIRALWRAFSGYRVRSTTTHLVIERRKRITPTVAELAAALDKHKAAEHADWTKVRRLEWEIYGQYKTGLDGRPLDEDDPAAHVKDGSAPAKPEGTPCWCNFCKGRVGVHGPEAVALYQAQAKAAMDQSRYRQKLTNVRAGGHVTQVVSAGRSITVSGDGVVITSEDGTMVVGNGNIQINRFG